MLIAALLVGLINPLSSASLVSFHLALPCLILVVEAVRRLHFTWLRLSRHRRGQLPDAHLAMPNQDAGSGVDRRRHALFGPRRRFGDILAWDSFFHLGHKDQRTMFGIFALHAASGAILMFNAGFGHGEAVGSYRGGPLYHASLDASERSLVGGLRFRTHRALGQ